MEDIRYVNDACPSNGLRITQQMRRQSVLSSAAQAKSFNKVNSQRNMIFYLVEGVKSEK